MKAGSLFSGIGGFCLGFQAAGITTAWAVDKDFYATETYQRNIPGTRMVNEDIQKVSVSNYDLEPVEVLHEGFHVKAFPRQEDGKASMIQEESYFMK